MPKRVLIAGHWIFAVLLFLDLIMRFTIDTTFRGVYADRISFWGLLITGALFSALYKGQNPFSKIYFGFYLYYPTVALLTFLIDRIMFVIVASPILASLLIPDTYYKDNKFEIRSGGGVLAPHQLVLVETNHITESQVGWKVYNDEANREIKGIEILGKSAGSLNVRLHYALKTEMVTFTSGR